MSASSTVSCIQDARKAGLDMREVTERLDAAVGRPDGLSRWKEWVRSEILKTKNLALGH
jgi:hypothetical protein